MSRRALFAVTALATLLALVVGSVVARRLLNRGLAPDAATYEAATRAFFGGLASLEVGLLDDARQDFSRVVELVPAEPAAWANLGLVHVRLGEYEAAAEPLDRASSLAPDSGDMALMLGLVESTRGRADESLRHLQRAVELDAQNLRARFALAEQLEAAGVQNADDRAGAQLDALLERAPDNLVVLLERTRLAVKGANAARLRELMMRIDSQRARAGWSARAEEQYLALQRATEAQNFGEAAQAIAFLRNVLAPTPAFQESLAAVRTESGLVAEPFNRFLRLPSPRPSPAPPDDRLTFSREALGPADGEWAAMIAFSIDGDAAPTVVAANDGEVRRIDPASVLASGAGGRSLLALDWNYDFRTDLVTAGRDGLRLLLQTAQGSFADATETASRSAGAPLRDSVGVWAADIEMDGDLDIVVGLEAAAPAVLRNNGDGTWRRLEPFSGMPPVRAFAWADLDRDADPDAVFLDSNGTIRVFENRQAGEFRPMQRFSAAGSTSAVAFAVGDLNADGAFEIVTLDAGGSIHLVPDGTARPGPEPLVVWRALPDAAPGHHRLFLSDLDNNGALDVVASGTGGSSIWLAGGPRLIPLTDIPDAEIFTILDLNGDGYMDLAGLSGGQIVRMLGHGERDYHWQVVRPRAQSAAGDQRINSFGVGGEIEVRSGLLVQKQLITGPAIHFGLGTHEGIDVARVLWPNGVVQAEFDRPADQVITAEQRLKGSCPWVFAYDGAGMRFVTDFLWRSPLGLRINAQDTAGVTQTEDRVRIPGRQLIPRNGVYDIRITAELWETHFFDHVSLIAVDHPDDVDMFVDERFAREAPSLTPRATARPRPVPRAWDNDGRDVTDTIARQDGRYVANFERGAYQGIAADHFVELTLDQALSRDRPLWLLANGWIYPTDSSINVAIGQGEHVQPRGVALEAQNQSGQWITVAADLGFPAGKNKTIMIDLSAVSRAGLSAPRRLRLRTNLEIYWDWLALAEDMPADVLKMNRLQPSRAELRYRGFSQTSDLRSHAPETPTYGTLLNVGQRWRDLTGYYTRFGDVRPLLHEVDDRYVIMNAGDELRLEFPAAAPPPSGWRRDFVLVGDGWEKDGDYNTGFSATVHPLPSHDSPEYTAPANGLELEHDPVYQRHAGDWTEFHTRFVTPRRFVGGLTRTRP